MIGDLRVRHLLRNHRRKAAYLWASQPKRSTAQSRSTRLSCGPKPDEEAIARPSSVSGVGTWTAQMFLIFQLMRPDV